MLQLFQRWYKAHKMLFWILAGLFTVYTLAGFVAVPLVTHHILGKQVSQSLSRKVQAGQVRANPFTFSLRLRDLRITSADEAPLATVDQLYVNIDPVTSLFKWGVVVKSVQMDGPKLNIIRTAPGQFNFSDMLQPQQAGPKDTAKDESGSSIRVVLNRLALNKGEIRFTDKVQAPAFENSVSELNLNMRHLDTHPDAGAAPFQITARTVSAEALEVDGKVDLHPLTAESNLKLSGLGIPKYMPYLAPFIDAQITDGTVQLALRVDWSPERRTVSDIDLTVAELNLKGANTDQPMVAIPDFKVDGANIDLNTQNVQLGRISASGARINLHRDARGELNLAAVVATQPKSAADADKQDRPPTSSEQAWVVTLPELSIDDVTVRFNDDLTAPPAQLTLGQMSLKAKQLSTQEGRRGTAELSLQWADQGRLTVAGEVGLTPVQATVTITAEEMDIRPLQPYINPFARLVLTKGNFNTEGQLDLVPLDDAMDIQYRGQAAINDFQSVDPVQAVDFLKWQSLYLTGLDLGTAPFRLAVSDMALTDFYNRLNIDDQGRSNLEAILGRKDDAGDPTDAPTEAVSEKTVPAEEKAAAPDISIKTVTLQGGQVDFSDAFVKPKVHLPMNAIGGRISGLDAIKTNKADVLLRGMVNKRVPMEIKGQINPLIETPYIDLTLSMAGIDLSPLTPYSGKYLGYKLDKGQLSMNLTYLVADNQLTAQNKILLHQLTLGETVSSPKATKLPIKLALALLKDRQGDIDLDLPVSGDLDDPEFSIGGIVVKMFVNLIVSIVSSPFKMLGALFGGGEELAFLEFDAGLSSILPDKKGQLDTLAKILHERPGLKLEIQGQVNPDTDKEGLRKERFKHQLKAAKLNNLVAGGQKALPLEQIELSPQEHSGLVQAAYAAAEFPKPRDAQGQIKQITLAEMEKLLYTAIEVTDDDLRILAHQRAGTAKDYLVTQAGVDVTRVFVIEPNIAGGEEAESKQQVKFSLN